MKQMIKYLGATVGAAALASVALAGGGFTNGGFETGDLSGWTVTPTSNGQTIIQQVDPFDVTGSGSSLAGHFQVGQVNFNSGVQEGIDLTQTLSLVAGTMYTISFDWAADNPDAGGGNAEGGVFSVVIDGQLLGTQEAGDIDALETIRGSISIDFTPATTGDYEIGARMTRPYTPSGRAHQYVDNFSIVPAPGAIALFGIAGAFAGRRRRRN